MKTYELSALLSAVIITAGLVYYIWVLIKGQIKTVAASWIVSTTALLLSLVTYFTSPNANWFGATLNAFSAASVLLTLIAVLIQHRIERTPVTFNPFQKKCLIASGMIAGLWVIIKWGMSGTGIIPNLLTQLMLVISYAMLIARFWRATKNTECLFTWWCVLISSVIGIWTAWMKNDGLAAVYAIRSTVMCAILVYALHRINWTNRRNRSYASEVVA